MNSNIRRIVSVTIFCWLLVSCAQIKSPRANHKFSTTTRTDLYAVIARELEIHNATAIKECNCRHAFYRDFDIPPTKASRYIFDQKVADYAVSLGPKHDTVRVLAFGAGFLLNELTALGAVLQAGKNLEVYLYDVAYTFFDDPNFESSLRAFAKNRKLIPPNWQGSEFEFFLWQNKKPVREQIAYLSAHHQAINQFKSIMTALDKRFNTVTTVHVLKTPHEGKLHLPAIDLWVSIDAYQDIVNVMRHLEHKMVLTHSPVRFLSLSKMDSNGCYLDNPEKEATIFSYEITNTDHGYSYSLIEKLTFKPTEEQRRKGRRTDQMFSPLH